MDNHNTNCDCCNVLEDELEVGLYKIDCSPEWSEGELCFECWREKRPFPLESLEYWTSASYKLKLELLNFHQVCGTPYSEGRHGLFGALLESIEWDSLVPLIEYRAGAYQEEKDGMIGFFEEFRSTNKEGVAA